MRALDALAKNSATDGAPLNVAAVRARCEGGDREACLAYGLMAVRLPRPCRLLRRCLLCLLCWCLLCSLLLLPGMPSQYRRPLHSLVRLGRLLRRWKAKQGSSKTCSMQQMCCARRVRAGELRPCTPSAHTLCR
jgi:hypothetical protein